MKINKLKISDVVGMRLDKALFVLMPKFSRSEIQKMIKNSSILLNGKNTKANYILKEIDNLEILKQKREEKIIAEKNDINILRETDDYLLCYKPSGISTHLDKNHRENTLVNKILKKLKLDDFEDKDRAGIVHRLDKDTSGLILVAKNKEALKFYFQEFKNRKVKKKYFAVVLGFLEHKEGVINSPITRSVKDRKKMTVSSDKRAKSAITEYKVLKEIEINGKKLSLLDINLKTGRTHQIRVHFSAISHPVLGDVLYGNKKDNLKFDKRMYLQAYLLSYKDFGTNEKLKFEIKMDDEFENLLALG